MFAVRGAVCLRAADEVSSGLRGVRLCLQPADHHRARHQRIHMQAYARRKFIGLHFSSYVIVIYVGFRVVFTLTLLVGAATGRASGL